MEIMSVKEWMECNGFDDVVVYEKEKMRGVLKYTLSEAIEQYIEYLEEIKNATGEHSE